MSYPVSGAAPTERVEDIYHPISCQGRRMECAEAFTDRRPLWNLAVDEAKREGEGAAWCGCGR